MIGKTNSVPRLANAPCASANSSMSFPSLLQAEMVVGSGISFLSNGNSEKLDAGCSENRSICQGPRASAPPHTTEENWSSGVRRRPRFNVVEAQVLGLREGLGHAEPSQTRVRVQAGFSATG